jgi:YYY domain-containing protein
LAIESQVLAVLAWLAVLKLVQLALWPALKPLFGRYAYPVSFSASVLGLSLLAWYLGTFGLPVQLAVAPFLVLLGWFAYRRAYTLDVFAEHWRWDAVFLVLFVFMLECRYINPAASFAEKFMDFGFVASIMRTPIVPPWDPWYAGGHLNIYYYYGSWIMGVLGLSSGVSSGLVFNLGLPTVIALAGVNCYMVGHLLLDRYRWLPILPLILPNPASVLYAAQGIPLSKVAWDSTRVIAYTINEYPLFSFTWGDLHAHVIGIFNQAFLIALLVLALVCWPRLVDRSRLVLVGLVALSLGAMPGINSWDVLIYGPITLVVAGYIWLRHRHEGDAGRVTPLHLLIAAPVLAIALYAPYYLSFASSGIKGVGLVTAPSDPVQFMLVHGFFLAIAYLACVPELRRRPYLAAAAIPFLLGGFVSAAITVIPLACLVARLAARDGRGRPEDLLVAFGLAVALLCELVYLKDNMGDLLFRQNTVFKLYIVAWLLMGIGTFVMAGRFLDRPAVTERVARVPAAVRRGLVIGVLALLFAAPFLAAGNFTHDTYTLDGTAFLDRWHPGDAEAIRFLQGMGGQHVIVEAKGDDYSYGARVSSFTGIPTVIGWTFHEYMWRNDYGPVQERAADVRSAYEDPTRTVAVMEKYGADLIYVGDFERETYQVSLPPTGLKPVYDRGGVQIYRRTGGG